MKMNGNTILITGGGSGIGRGLAEAFHHLGNQLIITGRRLSRLHAVCDANPGMIAVELDIRDPEAVKRVTAQIAADHPALNVLINNAGIMELDNVAGGLGWASQESERRRDHQCFLNSRLCAAGADRRLFRHKSSTALLYALS